MTVDPTDPETFEDENGTAGPVDVDVEAPEADAAEQRTDLAPRRDDVRAAADPRGADNADEGDRAEQARVVDLDEDDYR